MVHNIDEIYREQSQTVYRFLYSYTHDADLSEELTQETFYRAMKSINKYNGKCKISVWLCQIAKHILYQEWNKKNKNKTIAIDDNFEASTYSTEELIISHENKKDIYKMIQALNNTTREVMYLRLTGDLSFKEIGEILGKTENWARVTFYRGKSKIIRRIEDEE
ncbi:RNA polymerase sigma factor [Clostridium sp. DL1XJH146]